MSVKVIIHPLLQMLADNHGGVETSGDTVARCLDQLVKQFPGVGEWLFDAEGKLRSQVDIFINGESFLKENLDKPVADGDVLHLIAFVGGG